MSNVQALALFHVYVYFYLILSWCMYAVLFLTVLWVSIFTYIFFIHILHFIFYCDKPFPTGLIKWTWSESETKMELWTAPGDDVIERLSSTMPHNMLNALEQGAPSAHSLMPVVYCPSISGPGLTPYKASVIHPGFDELYRHHVLHYSQHACLQLSTIDTRIIELHS